MVLLWVLHLLGWNLIKRRRSIFPLEGLQVGRGLSLVTSLLDLQVLLPHFEQLQFQFVFFSLHFVYLAVSALLLV